MDPALIYTLDVEKLSELAPGLPREAIRVATLFDGRRRLREVLRDSFLTSRMTVSVFGRLRDLDLVSVLPDEPETPAEPETLARPVILAAPEPVSPPALDDDEAADTMVTGPPTLEADDTADTVRIEAPALEIETPQGAEALDDTVVTVPPTAATRHDFDEADRAFFDSYQPEDSTVDTFWDLEENPRKQRAARALQKRLSRRPNGGWLASLLIP